MERRTFVKGAAWAAPVIAAAVAVPLAAASQPASRSKLKLTHARATVGGYANTIYITTQVRVEGPDPIEGVVLTVTFSRGAETITQTWPLLPGWGNTGEVKLTAPGIAKGEPVVVTFVASAPGHAPVPATDTVETPSWWR